MLCASIARSFNVWFTNIKQIYKPLSRNKTHSLIGNTSILRKFSAKNNVYAIVQQKGASKGRYDLSK